MKKLWRFSKQKKKNYIPKYIEYEIGSDGQQLAFKKYLENIRGYLKNMMDDLKTFDEAPLNTVICTLKV